jgi:hypothetical protein
MNFPGTFSSETKIAETISRFKNTSYNVNRFNRLRSYPCIPPVLREPITSLLFLITVHSKGFIGSRKPGRLETSAMVVLEGGFNSVMLSFQPFDPISFFEQYSRTLGSFSHSALFNRVGQPSGGRRQGRLVGTRFVSSSARLRPGRFFSTG